MAFVSQYDDDQAQSQGSGQTGGTGGGTISGSGSSLLPQSQRQSGSWTNLNKYLDTNKDQTNDMADSIKQSYEDTYSDETNKSDAAKNDYSNVKSGIANNFYASDIDALDTDRDYKTEYGNAIGKIGDTDESRKKLSTSQGVLGALGNIQGKNATGGMTKLNQMLLRNSDEARGTLGEYAQGDNRQTSDMTDFLDSMSTQSELESEKAAASAKAHHRPTPMPIRSINYNSMSNQSDIDKAKSDLSYALSNGDESLAAASRAKLLSYGAM